MTVKNYYALTPEELDKAIDAIREWLFNFPNHKEYKRVLFALDVALCAKELERTPETQFVIDILTNPLHTTVNK